MVTVSLKYHRRSYVWPALARTRTITLPHPRVEFQPVAPLLRRPGPTSKRATPARTRSLARGLPSCRDTLHAILVRTPLPPGHTALHGGDPRVDGDAKDSHGGALATAPLSHCAYASSPTPSAAPPAVASSPVAVPSSGTGKQPVTPTAPPCRRG